MTMTSTTDRFTRDELRRAVIALNTVEGRGDSDTLAYILREAQSVIPSASLWGNATPRQQIGGRWLAERLAKLLGEPVDRCEQAAADVFAGHRHRAVFDALISYAEELMGHTSRRESATTSTPIHRPAVRIVEGAA